ncbi:hypothetical protein [Chitinimonas taiwanensis]|jgi:hypothetical protein|uniref:Lipoprotein n=1 Tax=Chitinimonas taiwanensis DSM 18899 TaxID=1121279 RepID=A0A1K2HNA4_9NEIS|nr:hypothetical protein [Chitinimonas taiwanensis]SFZ78049.1 hypothetical protein SAMN02745887_02757 [Chitinimonas taiwanensis DSM 18899]
MTTRIFLLAVLAIALSGCERVSELANQAKLNGRAIGAACRHTGRSLEDCFQRNPRVSKADIFAGWKEMNEYMTKNKLDVIPPAPDAKAASGPVASIEIGGGTDAAEEEKPAETKQPAPAPGN